MNKLCIVLILFILFSSCYGPKLNEKKIKVQIHFISKINSDKFDAKEGIFYSIKIDLINNGDSTDRFWIMSCSWEENWISNNCKIQFYNSGCDKNIPKLAQLDPGQKLTFNGILKVLENRKNFKGDNDFKLGFILIKEQDAPNNLDFQKLLLDNAKVNKNIIWSNRFNINK